MYGNNNGHSHNWKTAIDNSNRIEYYKPDDDSRAVAWKEGANWNGKFYDQSTICGSVEDLGPWRSKQAAKKALARKMRQYDNGDREQNRNGDPFHLGSGNGSGGWDGSESSDGMMGGIPSIEDILGRR